MVRIAVPASGGAGVVGTDVVAHHAVTVPSHAVVLQIPELYAVSFSEHVQSDAARGCDSEPSVVPACGACLDGDVVFRGNLSQPPRKLLHVLLGQNQKLVHVELELVVHLNEAENTAVNVSRKACRHVRESNQVLLYGVFFREQDRIISPCDSLLSHDFFQFEKSVYARVDVGNPRLNVLSVCRDGIMEESVVFVRDFMEPRQDWRIVF